MKSNLTVDFGDGVTSIFFWHEAETLQKLKECIYKRYNVPVNNQVVKHKDVVADEELFSGLFRNRFHENLVFKVETPDPTIIKHRRTWIKKQNRISKMDIPFIFSLGDNAIPFKFKVEDPERKVSDLKRDVRMKAMLPVERRVFLLNDYIILTDEHVLADLFLDFDNVLITMFDGRHNLKNDDNFEPDYSKVVPYIDIQIPRIFGEHSIMEYPLLEIGDMRTSVMKSWIEAFFHIPVEEQELGQIAGNDFLFTLEVINNRETFVPREEIYLNVYSTTNDELRSVYRENNIRTMVPIHVTSFDTDHHWVYHYRGQNVKEFIENTLKIPEDRQRLFHEKFLVNLDQVYRLILRAPDTIEINLAAQVDDGENELLEIVQRLGISRMRSILIKHPVNDSVMFDLPLSKVERMKENWLMANQT